MARRAAVSKGELEVARVLWGLGEAGVRQVFEAMPEEKRLDFATVQTYLRRLEAKGYVRSRLEGRVRVYRSRIGSGTVIRETVGDLIDRLFDGESLPLLRHLIQERGISDAEVWELREMLDRREDSRGSE